MWTKDYYDAKDLSNLESWTRQPCLTIDSKASRHQV